MSNFGDIKTLLDAAFKALARKGVNVTGAKRSQLAAAISDSDFEDCTQINQFLTGELGEPVTDVKEAITKLTALKNTLRQAIVAKGTLVLSSEPLDQYAQKIRAIRSYADLTFSALMPDFILDPEPTGSTIVYMRPGATGDGTSWDNAMSDFVAAHESLTGNKNVIYMEEGVYPTTGDISLKNGIKIFGGFRATDHNWSSRNGFEHRTVFDAQLTHFRLLGNNSGTTILDGLTAVNAKNTLGNGVFAVCSYSKNLIAQDCTNSAYGGGFVSCGNSSNLIAVNCTAPASNGGGFNTMTNCNRCIAINCSAVNGGGSFQLTNCNNFLVLNCKATSQGGGCYANNNCNSVKIINCSSTGSGGATYSDVNCKNFLIINCYSTNGSVLSNPTNCQNYTVANCICNSTTGTVALSGNVSNANNAKIYNFVCLNNKDNNGTLKSFYLATANYYYKLYHCRADAAIGFAANAATNADIQNFYLIQNNNSETKFADKGTYPVVGNLPYDNNVINQKYLDGSYGNFNIPSDSVLAGAGYWEDGFSFGWDIDGKPRNASHCSIGAYEPVWA